MVYGHQLMYTGNPGPLPDLRKIVWSMETFLATSWAIEDILGYKLAMERLPGIPEATSWSMEDILAHHLVLEKQPTVPTCL